MLIKLDLKDAYHHVAVHPQFRKFLAFLWEGKVFCFKAMPFGLSIAPAVFTGLMGLPLKLLTSQNLFAIAYLDDWIIGTDSLLEGLQAKPFVVNTFQQLGFVINQEKSILTPSRRITWLGFDWDAELGLIRLPLKKCLGIKQKAEKFSIAKKATRREVESMIGEMGFVAQALPIAAVKKKLFQLVLRKWPIKNRDIPCLLHSQALLDLQWWLQPSNYHKWQSFRRPQKTVTLWTDASLKGMFISF